MHKVKIMIVDDEPVARSGIKNGIDWKKYGVDIVGEAVNGLEAYLLIQELNPHIIITDVKMPIMDGIELVKRVNAEMPYIKTIIISGYSEFEYAKQAITFGVEGYLLKPVDENELVELICGVTEKLDAERKRRLEKNFDYLLLKQDSDFINSYRVLEDRVLDGFRRFDTDVVYEAMEGIYELFVGTGNGDYYKEVCLRLIAALRLIMTEWCHGEELLDMELMIDTEIYRMGDNAEIHNWQKQKIREFINMIKVNKGHRFKKTINDIEQYVKVNIDKNITLRDIASLVFLSPQYLSKVFVQEKGKTFVEWLNTYRIEKAKTQLVAGEETIANVAGRVGFSDYKYFGTVFKKYTGMTPSEYKKRSCSLLSSN